MKEFLSTFHSIEASVLEEYIAQWQPYTLPKKTIMTAPGDTQKYWYYVQEGIQKSYYLNDLKQHIIAFTYPPSFTGIPESFFTQAPSKYYLETITDSQFLRISFEQHEAMLQKHRAVETFLITGILN